jgi:AraC-like DNA-binding protein
VQLLQHDLDTEWTLEAVATRAGYSKHHIAHAFTEYLGMAPLEYVRSLRLHRAAQRLAYARDIDLVRTANDAGYASVRAFRRAFEREFDLTPKAFVEQRSSLRGPPVAEEPPTGLRATPAIKTLGPWRGHALLTRDFSTSGLVALLHEFLRAARGPSEPFGVASASPAMGWAGAHHRREFRYVLMSERAAEPPFEPWWAPLGRYARFDFEGATGIIRDTYTWIFRAWLPRSRFAYDFANVVTLFDPTAWYASSFERSVAQICVPILSRR